MNDCVNAEVRDRLPELLNGRLAEPELFAVARHVDECADCKAELALLQAARSALIAATPSIDYAAIVDRLPAPGARSAPMSAPRRWTSWRIAAAASFVAVAAATASFFTRASTPSVPAAAPVAVAPAARASAPAAVTPAITPAQPVRVASAADAAPRATQVASKPRELAVQGDLSDLSSADLAALLDDVNSMDAIPAAEPDVGGVTLTGGI